MFKIAINSQDRAWIGCQSWSREALQELPAEDPYRSQKDKKKYIPTTYTRGVVYEISAFLLA
jgi:hypothetical protein